MPLLGGSYVEALQITPHKSYWFDIEEKVLSGNRGVATRIKKGIFFKPLPMIQKSFINLTLIWDGIEVNLIIDEKGCKILKK